MAPLRDYKVQDVRAMAMATVMCEERRGRGEGEG